MKHLRFFAEYLRSSKNPTMFRWISESSSFSVYGLQLPAQIWWWIITFHPQHVLFSPQEWAIYGQKKDTFGAPFVSRRGIPDAHSPIGFICHVPKVEAKKDQTRESSSKAMGFSWISNIFQASGCSVLRRPDGLREFVGWKKPTMNKPTGTPTLNRSKGRHSFFQQTSGDY